ncbi:hypothetical protein [Bilophila wadsworthia]
MEKLQKIEKLCEGPVGIYKRIDENRELLCFLLKNSDVIQRFPFVEGWIANTDNFYHEIQCILDMPEKDFRGGNGWPRDWPADNTPKQG